MRVAIDVKSFRSRPKSMRATILPPAATKNFSKPSALSCPALVFSYSSTALRAFSLSYAFLASGGPCCSALGKMRNTYL